MEVISFHKASVPHRWRPDTGVTQSLPAWRPAARPVASTMGTARRRRMGQPVSPGEVANVTILTLASLGAGFAGIALAVVGRRPTVKVVGALAAAFGISGLLNQIGRFEW